MAMSAETDYTAAVQTVQEFLVTTAGPPLFALAGTVTAIAVGLRWVKKAGAVGGGGYGWDVDDDDLIEEEDGIYNVYGDLLAEFVDEPDECFICGDECDPDDGRALRFSSSGYLYHEDCADEYDGEDEL